MIRSSRDLILTWLALMLLLAASAALAWLPLGWVNSVVSLGIALLKALLVALVFMRLRRSPWLLRIAALAGILTMALLFGLSATDYATRTPGQAPWQRPAAVAPRLGAAHQGGGPVAQSRQVAIRSR
jgi:cytochrome c oxidase subunit 4